MQGSDSSDVAQCGTCWNDIDRQVSRAVSSTQRIHFCDGRVICDLPRLGSGAGARLSIGAFQRPLKRSFHVLKIPTSLLRQSEMWPPVGVEFLLSRIRRKTIVVSADNFASGATARTSKATH